MEYSKPSHAVNRRTNIAAQNFTASSFEYAGRTAITVIGNITGKKYRFSYPGDKQNIDHRDVKGMQSIPGLKKIY